MTGDMKSFAYEVAAKDAAWPVLPIIMSDMKTGEIVYASKFGSDTFGYEVEELLGKSIELLVPEELRDAHSRWRQDTAAPKTRLMGVGRSIQGRKKDGTLFPVHVGLTVMEVLKKQVGVAFVIDLTGVVTTAMSKGAEETEGVSAHGLEKGPGKK